MTRRFEIRVDTSTRPQKNEKYGKSTAAWSIYCNRRLINSGLIYYPTDQGPNKVVYQGIIAALQQLELIQNYEIKYDSKDNIVINIDCKPVLDQLKQNKAAHRMIYYFNLISALKKKYPHIKFDFNFLNEKEKDFRKVDQIAKKGLDWLENYYKGV